MQFSIRWILTATAYVAIATFAFTQADWISADFLWAVSLLAFVYAALLACFARGNRQVKATGFVFSSACFLLCLNFGGVNAVPTTRLLNFAGIKQNAPVLPYYPPRAALDLPFRQDGFSLTPAVDVDTSLRVYPTPLYTPGPTIPNLKYPIYLRAGNAVGMMVFGLLGCLVGALAFRGAKSGANN